MGISRKVLESPGEYFAVKRLEFAKDEERIYFPVETNDPQGSDMVILFGATRSGLLALDSLYRENPRKNPLGRGYDLSSWRNGAGGGKHTRMGAFVFDTMAASRYARDLENVVPWNGEGPIPCAVTPDYALWTIERDEVRLESGIVSVLVEDVEGQGISSPATLDAVLPVRALVEEGLIAFAKFGPLDKAASENAAYYAWVEKIGVERFLDVLENYAETPEGFFGSVYTKELGEGFSLEELVRENARPTMNPWLYLFAHDVGFTSKFMELADAYAKLCENPDDQNFFDWLRNGDTPGLERGNFPELPTADESAEKTESASAPKEKRKKSPRP